MNRWIHVQGTVSLRWHGDTVALIIDFHSIFVDLFFLEIWWPWYASFKVKIQMGNYVAFGSRTSGGTTKQIVHGTEVHRCAKTQRTSQVTSTVEQIRSDEDNAQIKWPSSRLLKLNSATDVDTELLICRLTSTQKWSLKHVRGNSCAPVSIF